MLRQTGPFAADSLPYQRNHWYEQHAGGLEGPLKCVEYRDASDRDLAQLFDDYVACGFGLHDVLSYRLASAGSIDYINARGRDDPLIP